MLGIGGGDPVGIEAHRPGGVLVGDGGCVVEGYVLGGLVVGAGVVVVGLNAMVHQLGSHRDVVGGLRWVLQVEDVELYFGVGGDALGDGDEDGGRDGRIRTLVSSEQLAFDPTVRDD